MELIRRQAGLLDDGFEGATFEIAVVEWDGYAERGVVGVFRVPGNLGRGGPLGGHFDECTDCGYQPDSPASRRPNVEV